MSSGHLHLDGFESYTLQKIKAILLDDFYFLVETTGLEPVTSCV